MEIPSNLQPSSVNRSLDSLMTSKAKNPSLPLVIPMSSHMISSVSGATGKKDALNGALEVMQSAQHRLNQTVIHITQEAQQKITQQQNKLSTQQWRSLGGPLGGGYVGGIDRLQAEKKAARVIGHIEQEAERQIKLASLEYRKTISTAQKNFLNNILNERSQSDDASIKQLGEVEQKIFKSLPEDLKNLNDEELSWTLEKLATIDIMSASILAHGASSYLDLQENQLNRIELALKNTIGSDEFASFEGTLQVRYKDLQELLVQQHASFLFAEASSDEEASHAAQEAANLLQQKADELGRAVAHLQETSKMIGDQTPTDGLNHLILLKTKTETAAEACQAIARTYAFPLRSVLQQQEELEQQAPWQESGGSKIAATRITAGQRKKIENDLSQIIVAHNGSQKINSYDADLLAQLTSMQKTENDSMVICGEHGSVTIESYSASDLEERPHRYQQGLNTVRLAILRQYGIKILQQFDREFSVSSENILPVTIKALKNFLNSLNRESSYFFSTAGTPEAVLTKLLLSGEDSLEERVLKSDKTSYNPFSEELSSSQTGLDDETASKRGIEVTKSALKNFLQKQGASSEVTSSILKNFDQQFSSATAKKLTLGALRLFLQEELKKNSEWNIYSLLNVFSSAFKHPLWINLTLASSIITVGRNMTLIGQALLPQVAGTVVGIGLLAGAAAAYALRSSFQRF